MAIQQKIRARIAAGKLVARLVTLATVLMPASLHAAEPPAFAPVPPQTTNAAPLLVSLLPNPSATPQLPPPLAFPDPRSEVGRAIIAALDKEKDLAPADRSAKQAVKLQRARQIADQAQIERFYRERGGEPLWVAGQTLAPRTRELIAVLADADQWGMKSTDYPVAAEVFANATATDLALMELAYTRAVVAYAEDAQIGRFDPSVMSDLIDRMSPRPSAESVLRAVNRSRNLGQMLLAYQPQHEQFTRLREVWLQSRKRNLALPAGGPNLKPGTRHADIATIRTLLSIPAASSVDRDLYDPPLAEAIRALQTSKSMRADAIIGKRLRQAINRQANEKRATPEDADRLLANMERWRWLPRELGRFHIFNNIAEFSTRVVRDGAVIHEERTVVGKPTTPTSLFSKNMEYVEINPYWNVPESIKLKELLPALRRSGSGALARRGLKVSVNGKKLEPSQVRWNRIDMRKVGIFQPPGDGNALGRVKFMFPNSHDIYMHDTPSKDLFNRDVRAYSHGCIRVREPEALAEVILAEANGMTSEQVTAEFAKEDNLQIPLQKKFPVHIGYFTAWVEADGTVRKIDDVYGHDKRTTLALARRFGEINRQIANTAEIAAASRQPQRVVRSRPRTRIVRAVTRVDGQQTQAASIIVDVPVPPTKGTAKSAARRETLKRERAKPAWVRDDSPHDPAFGWSNAD